MVVILAIVLAAIFRKEVLKVLEEFLNWVKDNPVLGPVFLIILYIFCVVLFFPGSILTLGAGFALK